MNSKNKGLRIYSMARFLTFIIVVMIIAFLAGGLIFNSTVSGAGETKYETVTVMAGDTLWDIASEYNTDRDLRKYISEICRVNEISAADLYPGQSLKVPVV